MKRFLYLIFVSFFIAIYLNFSYGQEPIECSTEQLRNGQCKFNINQALGIRESAGSNSTSVGIFFQDIVLSATFFIGTIVTIVIIYAGWMYIWSSITGDDGAQTNARKGLINGLLGMLIVMSSYSIIRLIQYLVAGG